ncbi:MAG: hypothetical protein AAGJ95_05145 [Cyanobacteria bacterium J06554_11]
MPIELGPIEPTVVAATGIGFVSGFLISLQAVGLDYLINKTWMGWRITLNKFAFSISSLSFLFGLGAFLMLHWQPAKSLGIEASSLLPACFKIGLLISILTPISAQIRVTLAQPNEDNPASSSSKPNG